jgi:hypothetical protein
LIMNGRDLNSQATGMGYTLWNVLMFLGVILFWNDYPKGEEKKRTAFKILRWAGLGLLLFLLFRFRRVVGDKTLWLDPTNLKVRMQL